MFGRIIQIAFNSREKARITEPILKHQPHKLYYFTAIIRETGQTDEHLSYFKENCELLEQRLPNLEIIKREVDYTNYIEIIQEISKIIRNERKENPESEIFINVSSGSKITAIASVEAANLWECNIYYVYSTEYNPSSEGPEHKGEMIIKTPMTFPLKKPKKIYIKILQLIQKLIEGRYKGKNYDKNQPQFMYKKNLIKELFNRELITLQHKNKDERKLQASKYMKSQKYLRPMERELHFIRISDNKRNKKIFITDEGKEVLDIFKYYY
jgi:hypothetical protein